MSHHSPYRTDRLFSVYSIPRGSGRFSRAAQFLLCLWLAQSTNMAQLQNSSTRSVRAPEYRHDRILVMPKPGVGSGALANWHAMQKGEVLRTFEGMGGLQIVRLPEHALVPSFIARYEQSGLTEFVEPDYIGRVFATPNDPKYLDGTLWGLDNLGQSGGTVDADIDAPEGWDVLNSASNIVVAVVDTGVRYTHEDLAANMWINPTDGGHGWNALTGTNNPYDGTSPFSRSHGTLIAGIVGAVGNNGKGVAGVAWRMQMMICQGFSNSTGAGSISDVVTCLEYARTNGAKIINASWGFNPDSLSLSNAVYRLRLDGIIIVAACGNSGLDIDVTPSYPASYDFDNIVSVAYTTRNDTLAVASNYGATNVDLAAPGEQIYSTYAATDTFYNSDSGSSFAAPFVSGAMALLRARYPADTHQQIIARLLNASDPLPSLTGKCVTGGRLNLRKALSPPINMSVVSTPGNQPFQLRVFSSPGRTCVIEVTTNLTSWSPVFTNITSAGGTFDFTDNVSTNAPHRFFRTVSAL